MFRNDPGAQCRSSRGMKLHLTANRGLEQHLGSLQDLISDLGCLYARGFKLHGAAARVSGAVDRYRSSRDIEVTCGGVVWKEMGIGNVNGM
ncbi:hypothetical protein EVAR_50092_1 [Eumeta japonica]|uniref:Uncharacterized protein n=1 Tax=Eumeta variegata TaxID=151549 RepID=A0A4C1XUK2_EUMVA|nr:hypothetical protein EVAR_50092_1 [Eumeta japonica]